jgi:preprotein translocase subunit SecD
MTKTRITALILFMLGVLLIFFLISSERDENSRFPFHYGLDLDGGTKLLYRADISQVDSSSIDDAMNTLRRTIERRVNIFGVSEPIVTVEKGSIFGNKEDQHRLSVELPGVTNVEEAINSIGKTPLLEFRLQKEDFNQDLILETVISATTTPEAMQAFIYDQYVSTGLTGGQLKNATVFFGSMNSVGASISLEFDNEGASLLRDITKDNVGKPMAIFLDGTLISDPIIQQELFGGQAQITGNFTPDEAKELAQNLTFGALPVPIELIETNTIGPSLGEAIIKDGVRALTISFSVIFLFLILWYRLPGLIASISLAFYVVVMLALFKLIPVTLTASGIAGFILSIGIAVDANIIIFERIKEEIKKQNDLIESIKEGFSRGWPAIRDGNITSIIAAAILFWMSGSSVVKGFALVFGLGVIVSMLSAVFISRLFLLAVSKERASDFYKKLFGTGFRGSKNYKLTTKN